MLIDFVDDHLSGVTSALSDRYTIESELGRGGMAIVYRAQDTKHHRDVAIKVLRPEFTASIGVDRFLREVEIAAKLTHPHVPQQAAEADGRKRRRNRSAVVFRVPRGGVPMVSSMSVAA